VIGIVAYQLIGVVTTGGQTGSGTRVGPREVLQRFLELGDRRNETIVLVYKVRGDIPTSGYVLGTLDYLYLTVRKEFSAGNESNVYRVSYSALPYAVQPQLYVVVEVLGIAFRAENLSTLFLNPTVVSSWSNLSIESLGSLTVDNEALGRVSVSAYRYTYVRTVDNVPRNISVTVYRGVELGLVPVKAEVSIDRCVFTIELVNVQRMS
jgi:hypothetical protein